MIKSKKNKPKIWKRDNRYGIMHELLNEVLLASVEYRSNVFNYISVKSIFLKANARVAILLADI